MQFLLDENVPVDLIEWLAQKGHSAIRVPAGIKNGQVLELARREKRILITQDSDFANRLLYPPEKQSGIILLRIHPPQFPKITSSIERLLSNIQADALPGKLILLEEKEYHLIS
ncbi:MAG: DUF5615 family PIN-like protein [Candidatus Omnitrophica bacterium]|nr:DUF5615 family PIN-like protein [Candidatus Omnitrophota bacterium]